MHSSREQFLSSPFDDLREATATVRKLARQITGAYSSTDQDLRRNKRTEIDSLNGYIARWQGIRPAGFGPFRVGRGRDPQALAGLHSCYENYFHLRLDEQLDFLRRGELVSSSVVTKIRKAIAECHKLLQLPQGCLVHKDMALWNVLGTPENIIAIIDWDDTISGDPMDDLSLLACFHDAEFLTAALRSYQSVRPLPDNWLIRFWLHLLRNMIVKAVIRVGAGYFDRGNSFFLIGSGQNGSDLREFTLARLHTAMRGLLSTRGLDIL